MFIKVNEANLIILRCYIGQIIGFCLLNSLSFILLSSSNSILNDYHIAAMKLQRYYILTKNFRSPTAFTQNTTNQGKSPQAMQQVIPYSTVCVSKVFTI